MRGKWAAVPERLNILPGMTPTPHWRLRGVAPARMGCLSHLRSLGSAVQKTTLDASRITAVDHDSVSFRWTDRQSGLTKITRLGGEEFLRRFLQHVLPRGFMRVRHFGWLSPAARARYARVRHLLRAGEAVLKRPDKVELGCPGCGGFVKFRHALRPRARPPPMASLCA